MFAKQNAVFNYISTGYINFLDFLSCTEESYHQMQGGLWLVQPNTKKAPTLAIELAFLGSDKLALSIGLANPDWVKKHSLAMAAISAEEAGKQNHFLGQVRKLQLDLAQFVEQLFAKYPAQLHKMPSQSDFYNSKVFWLPEDKNGTNPLVLEKTEDGLQVKIEMQTLSVYLDPADGKKKIRNFTGMLYLKRIQKDTANTIAHQTIPRNLMQVNSNIKLQGDNGDGNETVDGFFAVDGYDAVKFFSQQYPSKEGGIWYIHPRTKNMSKQAIKLNFSNQNELTLLMGNANTQNTNATMYDVETMPQEELEKKYFFSGRIRQVHLDLNQFMTSQADQKSTQLDNKATNQEKDINAVNRRTVEKTEDGVYVKLEISNLKVTMQPKTGKKIITDFTGAMYLKTTLG